MGTGPHAYLVTAIADVHRSGCPGKVLGVPSTDEDKQNVTDRTHDDHRCCTSTPRRGPGRDRRTRSVPADPAERAVHRIIIRTFAATGRPPDPAQVEQAAVAEGGTVADVLGRLHAADVVRLGPGGDIRAAYPFSARPTRHRVRLANGVDGFAMCVIDALGIPPMLGADAVVTTTDPASGAPITVTAAAGRFAWDPVAAVVFIGALPGDGPSADTRCDYLNAFTDYRQAAAWMRMHPHVCGEIITSTQAEWLGRQIFGDLLTTGEPNMRRGADEHNAVAAAPAPPGLPALVAVADLDGGTPIPLNG
jgi:Alkylmercury lyase